MKGAFVLPAGAALSGCLSQSEQRAKGASWALITQRNPSTYRTTRIFFVLICEVIYLSAEMKVHNFSAVSTLASIASRYTLTSPCFPKVNLHFIVQCD